MQDEAPLELVTVYSGPVWRVLLLEGRLEAEGIPALVPDRIIKTIDPFITGANALELRLQVPSRHLAAARAVIAEDAPEPRAIPETDPDALRAREVAALGRRIRWAAWFGFTSPFALSYALRYFREAVALPQPPPGHRLTIAAIPIAILTGIAFVFWLPWA